MRYQGFYQDVDLRPPDILSLYLHHSPLPFAFDASTTPRLALVVSTEPCPQHPPPFLPIPRQRGPALLDPSD